MMRGKKISRQALLAMQFVRQWFERKVIRMMEIWWFDRWLTRKPVQGVNISQ